MLLSRFRAIGAAAAAAVWLLNVTAARGAATAYDDASQPAYSGGWQNGTNGGTGFGPWQFARQQNNVSTGGYFIGSSAANGGVGNIDTAGKAFGMYANSGNTVQAFRSLLAGGPNNSPALQPGQTLTINIDNGNVDEGGAIGFHLRNRDGLRRMTLEFVGGEYFYRGSGLVPFTRNGLQIVFVQGRNNFVQLSVTTIGGRSVSYDSYIDASDIEQIEFFNSKAGGGSASDFFVNSMSVSTAGRVDPSFGRSLGIAGRTKTVALTATGQIVVGGSFSSRVARLNSDGTRDHDLLAETGINDDVHTVVPLSDGRMIIAGSFSSVGGHERPGLARINAEGSNDWTFYANGGGYVLSRLADGRILRGSRTISRVDQNGAEETSAFPGIDTDGEILAIAVQPDGRILIGGTFKRLGATHSFPNTVWAFTRPGIARLNSDGTVDESFNPGAGVNGSVVAIAVQPDGAIVIGGLFTAVGGVARQNLARLQPNGALDSTFASDANGKVGGILLRPDNKAVVVGTFTRIQGVDRSAVARIHANGAVDTDFNTGVSLPFVGTINNQVGAFGDPVPGAEPIVADSDGRLLIAPFGTLQRLHPNGARDLSFEPDVAPGPNSSVGRVARSSAGGYLISGNFSRVGATSAPGVTRLADTGLHDSTFNAGLGGVSFCSLEQTDGAVLIGQAPSVIDGVARGGLVRVNKNGNPDATFNAGVGGSFTALAEQSDGKIVVLRDPVAHALGELAPNTVTRLNANGSVDPTFQEATIDGVFMTAAGFARVLIDQNGKIVVWGRFSKINGQTVANVARLNANGTVDQTFQLSVSASSGVTAVTHQADGKIILGDEHGYVARFNVNGSRDSAFFDAGYFWGGVNCLAMAPDGKIIVGGSFDVFETFVDFLETTPAYTVQRNVARLNSDGTLDLSFAQGTGADGPVYDAIVQTGGKIILAGDFTQFDRHDRNYVARLNSDGSLDKTFSPGVGLPSVAAVSLQSQDGKVIVAGDFAAAGGQPANALARLRTDGSLDPSFQPPYSPGDSVQAITQRADGVILAASLSASPAPATNSSATKQPGTFRQREAGGRGWPDATSTIKNPIRPCTSSGDFDVTFNNGQVAGTNGVTHCLGLQGPNQSILVAGAFSQLNGADGHLNVGRLNGDGTLDTSFVATADQPVRALGIQTNGAKAIIAGDFTHVNGTPANRIARLNYDGSLDSSFASGSGTNGPVTALVVGRDEKIVVGGNFTTVAGSARPGLARLHSNGALDVGFVSPAVTRVSGTPQIQSIVEQPQDGKIIVAGLFDAIGNVARRNIARLNSDGSVDTTYDPGAGPDAIVRSLALQADGKALLGGDFTTVDVYARTAAARLFGDSLTAMQQWRLINFGTIDPNHSQGGDAAAPHGDGVPNLMKYALNLDPSRTDTTAMTASGTKGLPLVQLDPDGRVLSLTFVRRQASSDPGIDYSAQFSSDLSAPSSFVINPDATTTVTRIDGTWERVTVKDNVSASTQRQRFGRVKVTRP